MRKVSIGVSPISLKKNRCSRHFRPMERSAGSRRRSLANLENRNRRNINMRNMRKRKNMSNRRNSECHVNEVNVSSTASLFSDRCAYGSRDSS